MSGKLEGKIALITGASRGIGAAVAKRFAAEGAQVILVARTVSALEAVDDEIQKAGHKPAVLVPLDLKEFDKIDALGEVIAKRFKKLDILVGNAGMLGDLTPVPHARPKMWEGVIATNLTANYRLIRSLDPLLRASEAGRAIFVTSGVTKGTFPYWGAYAASKAGLEMLVNIYAEEVAHSQMRVHLVDPGIVATDMRAAAFPGENASTLATPENITDKFLELVADVGAASRKEKVRRAG